MRMFTLEIAQSVGELQFSSVQLECCVEAYKWWIGDRGLVSVDGWRPLYAARPSVPGTDSYSALGWLGNRVVSVLDSGAEGPGFKSQSRRCWVTLLGKLFTPVVPLFIKQRNW